jgi:plastocyanin
MVDITQRELQELVRQYARGIREAKQTVVGEDGPQPHSPGMQYGLMTQAAKTGMSVYYFNALANHDVAKDGKEGEDRGEGRLAIDDEEGNVVDFEAIGQVPYACSPGVGVCNDDDLVSAIDEFLKPMRLGTQTAEGALR